MFQFQKDEVFLNLVLEYVPETVYRVARHYSKSKQTIPILYIKVGTVNVLNISNIFLVPFSNKMLIFSCWNSQNACRNSKQGRL